MRAALALAALAACSSADSSPGASPERKPAPPPAPTGVIAGSVSMILRGPGRARPSEESTSRTLGLGCDVAITGKLAARSEHTAKDSGRYDATLPAGTYTLSFAACAPSCCAGEPTTREVTVTAGKTTTADWSCACDAK